MAALQPCFQEASHTTSGKASAAVDDVASDELDSVRADVVRTCFTYIVGPFSFFTVLLAVIRSDVVPASHMLFAVKFRRLPWGLRMLSDSRMPLPAAEAAELQHPAAHSGHLHACLRSSGHLHKGGI